MIFFLKLEIILLLSIPMTVTITAFTTSHSFTIRTWFPRPNWCSIHSLLRIL